MEIRLTTPVKRWAHCCHDGCGISIYGPPNLETQRRQDHAHFYCLNGHRQYFPQDSDIERAQQQRDLAQRERDQLTDRLEREKLSHRATRGHVTRIKKRVGAGTCPCCKRTFQQLSRHMSNKHPGYGESKS